MQVLQRRDWDGHAKQLDDLLRLKKNRRTARAVLFTHPLGWEVRLLVGGQRVGKAVRTQVCRSQEDVLSTGEGWASEMRCQGWR
jgi:hypothetical protein